MKFLLGVVFLLSLMISTGFSLTCISCTSTTQTPCTGTSVTCTSTEDVCTSIYTETKLKSYGLTTYAIVRGCGTSSECNSPKSLSNQFMSVDINTGCCSTDNCTPVAPIVSSGNATVNGLVCPSCFSLSSSTCVPTTTIDCTGNENRCTTYSISSATSPPTPIMAMEGCATENMCSNYTGTASTSTTGAMSISIGCSNATVSHIATSTVSPATSKASVSSDNPVATTTGIRTTSHAMTQSYYVTTDIANSYPTSNSSAVYYSTRVTFTPTAFHSTIRDTVTSTVCVCGGCAGRHVGFAFIVTLTFSLIKCLL